MLSPEGPVSPESPTQEVRVTRPAWDVPRRTRRRPGWWTGPVISGIVTGLVCGAYLFAPLRTNVLILGLDSRPGEGAVSRTDTMILTTFRPDRPYVGMLSIPRDLWVELPGGQENRINAAHFFAEADAPGTGPQAAKQVVSQTFGVPVDVYVRLDFDGVRHFVDALGGVEVDLPAPMSGLPAGRSRLGGVEALAFVRDRAGSDDFARMGRADLFIRAVLRQLSQPATWPRLPMAMMAMGGSVRTDVPVWLWPRLAVAALRVGASGLDARVIDRAMTTGFTTSGGAQVLAPNWNLIRPVLEDMFSS
jgi:LCP family protein required for cell wall assembly